MSHTPPLFRLPANVRERFRQTQHCPCGTLFRRALTTHTRRYCSERCKRKYTKQRWRARQKGSANVRATV